MVLLFFFAMFFPHQKVAIDQSRIISKVPFSLLPQRRKFREHQRWREKRGAAVPFRLRWWAGAAGHHPSYRKIFLG